MVLFDACRRRTCPKLTKIRRPTFTRHAEGEPEIGAKHIRPLNRFRSLGSRSDRTVTTTMITTRLTQDLGIKVSSTGSLADGSILSYRVVCRYFSAS